jgi:hypothetical protein
MSSLLALKAGAYYRTRCGLKVYIVGNAPLGFEGLDDNCRALGFLRDEDGYWSSNSWDVFGAYIGPGQTETLDIVDDWREPVKIEGWINIWSAAEVGTEDSQVFVLWPSRAAADACASQSALGRHACVFVSGSEDKAP